MKKVSVIVPVWNGEKYLHKCIDSILGQTYKNLEVILVDDGSSDSSADICKKYAETDERVKFYQKENGGQASARNMALDYATGEYVGFVDNDDFCLPRMYEALVGMIEEYDADIARCADCISESEIDSPGQGVISVMTGEELRDKTLSDELGGHVTDRLFKREIIGNNRFPHSKTIEDTRFMRMILPFVSREVSTTQKLYFYMVRDDNTSNVYARGFTNAYERAIEFWDRYENEEVSDSVKRLIIKKATSFSVGTLRALIKLNKRDCPEWIEVKDLIKKYKGIICSDKGIPGKYRWWIKCFVR